MVATLPEKVPAFAGSASHVRCFNHVINLTAHSVVSQFDVPKAKADGALAAAEQALRELAEGTDLDEFMTREELDDDGVDDLIYDEDGFINERDTLTVEELEELSTSVLPVRLILVKVSVPFSKN
jgi:hypothetical protein